jgi:flagellar L-ring protein precursor FlgH
MVNGIAPRTRLNVAIAIVCVAACLFSGARAASLYNEAEFRPLTADQRARRAGDLITVLVVENSSATSTANTSAGRDANFGFDLQAPFGGRAGSVKLNNQTDGRGQTVRQGKVVASITVVVREVASNGDLLIAGEQMLEVNNERQQIKVEGRIRPQDIADTNTVSSTRIADARISYVGEGDLADRQRPGLWQRALTWLGL